MTRGYESEPTGLQQLVALVQLATAVQERISPEEKAAAIENIAKPDIEKIRRVLYENKGAFTIGKLKEIRKKQKADSRPTLCVSFILAVVIALITQAKGDLLSGKPGPFSMSMGIAGGIFLFS